MSRWKAASIHLAISACIVLSVFAAVHWLWYPTELLRISGTPRLIGLIALVDVVVGPLLTLIVYRQGKPHLRLDLSVIAVLQAGLLVYGLYVLAQNRPAFLVFAMDRFELVTANEIRPEHLAKAAPAYRRLSWTGAPLVGSQLPKDPASRSALLFDALAGADVQNQPEFFVDYAMVRPQVIQRADPIAPLVSKLLPPERARLEAVAGNRGWRTLTYLPIRAKHGAALMLLDANTADLLGPVDVDPWLAQERR